MNDIEKFISPHKITKKYGITSNTLRSWGESGKIRFVRPHEGLGKRLYNLEDIERMFGNTITPVQRKTVCYARVSSDHQKEDLDRQIKLLQAEFPGTEIIKDIGSGLNFKRKGFTSLLDRIHSNEIERVVVTYRDRMCRFGLEIVEWIFQKSNVEFLVLNSLTDEKDSTSELAEDLLSITTVFVARNNGNRSAKYRKQRKQEALKEQEEKTTEEEPEALEK